jgi:hypothetical protein
MRNQTANSQAASQATIIKPGYLVEIAWPTIVRLSTRGNQTWGGYAWTRGKIISIRPMDGGSLELLSADTGFQAMVLTHGASDVGCRVWSYYADALGDDDPILVFAGVLDGASEISRDKVALGLSAEHARTLYSPRQRLGPEIGITRMSPAGTRITWGGQTYTLERGG